MHFFGSENAFSNDPAWIRFDGREQTNTPKGISLINVGFDGMLVVVVKNKLYGFQIPTSGPKMEAQFKEIYSHNKNIIDVDVKDQVLAEAEALSSLLQSFYHDLKKNLQSEFCSSCRF